MIHCGREACLLGNDEEDNDPWVPCDNEASDTCLATPPITKRSCTSSAGQKRFPRHLFFLSLFLSLSLCVQVVCRNNATANTPISWDWFEGRKITLKYQSNPKKMPKIIWLPSNPPPKHVHISHIYMCVCMCLCVCACMCIYTYNFILHYIIVYHIILDCVK
jgi:hypothetical protein